MELLRDEDLAILVAPVDGTAPIFSGIDLHEHKLGSKKSQVQPSSIDLTIGSIYFPERKEDEKGGSKHPLVDAILKPGQTAVIGSREIANLPANISAFAFPPTRISTAGVLIVNPGHIDPGYKGHLTVIVTNMGREDFVLWQGDVIITCLVVRLKAEARFPYDKLSDKRTETLLPKKDGNEITLTPDISASEPTNPSPTKSTFVPRVETMDRLSLDFLDVGRRAEEKAEAVGLRIVRNVSIVAVAVAFIGLVAPAWLELFQPLMELSNDVNDLENHVTNLWSDPQTSPADAISKLSSEMASLSQDLAEHRELVSRMLQKFEGELDQASQLSSDQIKEMRAVIDDMKEELRKDPR